MKLTETEKHYLTIISDYKTGKEYDKNLLPVEVQNLIFFNIFNVCIEDLASV